MSNKVIEFPKHKVVREIPEEIHQARAKKSDQKFADTIVEELGGLILTELDNYDLPVDNKQFAKDYILVIDSLRAAVYRSLGLEHHLHPFIDENVKILEGNVEGLSKEEIADQIAKMIEDISKEKVDTEEEE